MPAAIRRPLIQLNAAKSAIALIQRRQTPEELSAGLRKAVSELLQSRIKTVEEAIKLARKAAAVASGEQKPLDEYDIIDATKVIRSETAAYTLSLEARYRVKVLLTMLLTGLPGYYDASKSSKPAAPIAQLKLKKVPSTPANDAVSAKTTAPRSDMAAPRPIYASHPTQGRAVPASATKLRRGYRG